MIGWLQGRLAEIWPQPARCGVLLDCRGVGYELTLSSRHGRDLPPIGAELTLHVHTSAREDGWTLFGFPDRIERDLFRELVTVSGVGPQAALALLGSLEPRHLVEAIVQTDLRRLCQAPGVGRRTAERLAVELRQRLTDRFPTLLGGVAAGPEEEDLGAPLPEAESREEVIATLESLGFEALEAHRALRAVATAGLDPGAGAEAWIRDCLRWLSRSAA